MFVHTTVVTLCAALSHRVWCGVLFCFEIACILPIVVVRLPPLGHHTRSFYVPNSLALSCKLFVPCVLPPSRSGAAFAAVGGICKVLFHPFQCSSFIRKFCTGCPCAAGAPNFFHCPSTLSGISCSGGALFEVWEYCPHHSFSSLALESVFFTCYF